MKKVMEFLLTILLPLSIVSPASASSFKDVTLYKDEIGYLVGEILEENIESKYVKGLYLSPRVAEILLKELQNNTQG